MAAVQAGLPARAAGCCLRRSRWRCSSALPDALLALWFKLLGDGVLAHDCVARACSRRSALGVSATATWFLRTVSTRVQRRFRDKVTIALESHVATLQASIATIAHQERPEYLDRLAVLRNQVFVLDHMYMSLFSTCGVDPAAGRDRRAARVDSSGARAAAVFALPTVLTSSWRPAVERHAFRSVARRRTGWRGTCSTIATTAPPGKEVRVTGIGDAPDHGAPARVGALVRPSVRRRAGGSAVWHTLAWAVFGVRLCRRHCVRRVRARRARRRRAARARGRARACRPTSARPSARSASCAASGWTARDRLAWLEDYAALVGGDCRPAGARAARTRAFASSTCRSPIRAPTAWCSTT